MNKVEDPVVKKKIKFSIPYNGDLKLVKEAISSGQVYEVYFAGPQGLDFSDSFENHLFHSLKQIIALLDYCRKSHVKTSLLVNKKIMFFEDLKKIESSISRLLGEGGVDSLTVTDTFLVPFLKEKFPSIELQSSIYLGIDSVHKAREALKMGFSLLGLDPSVNRRGEELKRIMGLKKVFPEMKVKLLGILTCYSNCFFASTHSQLPVLLGALNKSSLRGCDILGKRISPFLCHYQSEDISDELKRPFIRPEDISYYENNCLADYIKIAYRDEDSRILREKYTAYFNRSYKGNLFLLMDSTKHSKIYCDNKEIPKGFIRKVMNCDKDCHTCSYCRRLALRLIK
ncbi:MAG: hypothetical protein PHP89_04465 [Candidatus Omnitrophica bacterium]|jgi:hypothetical protein|nr:hypothetical protein [Candidatus Omnitrophota bacterium]MDD3987573.1 hypothetical protein [Candidatus Omnitrophota bacterium]MDD4981694.1 hypothetical protein [Candidatus Omnitrophota bacterium]MDD5664815.1 hypothetical protein [Candidatus Omnitrophota bacterium]